ncbi:MAG: hypothetical protein EOM52_11280 [Clostridia bacterium]|nr:hypothetical protein [Clostridia bacterium]
MKKYARFLSLVLALLCVPPAFFLFAGLLGSRVDAESLSLTAQGLRRAAVQCYALEGAYPAGLSYLEAHYGVAVDPKRYLVDYQFIGSNLMPDITVLPRTD